MYRWCSKCNDKRRTGDTVCPICQHSTDLELDLKDTLRIDAKREFVITKQLSHFTDAGMSAVYLAARTDKPDMFGAIKVAKPSKVEALKREAEVLQKLKHDHIIRLVHPERALWQDHKDNTTLHFFALEYMDGGSLKDRLNQRQKLPLAEAIPIILAVGQALAYAHQNNYLHLDVKPANILFGSDGRIVLSDFGIARVETQAGELKKRIGTLFYNSPEQLANPPAHTHKADIYALGIMLYEMLVGADRFRQHRSSSSSKEDSHAPAGARVSPHQNLPQWSNLPPPRKLEPHIPRPVERVILKAIAPNPADRYDSITAMLDDLTRSVTQPPPYKNLLLLLAGVGMFLAIGLIGLGIFFMRNRQDEPAAATTPPTATATLAPATPVVLPSVTIVEPSTTPAPTDTPLPQQGDSLPKPPTSTRAPTNTPTPVPRIAAPSIKIDSPIELIAPANDIQLPNQTVQFQWRWLENDACVQPPDGYAFEIRVWRDNNIDGPQGAMDAKTEKQNIQCDPTTGLRSFTIGNIKSVPGFQNTREGRFRWDVALVKLDPYQPVVTPQFFTFFTD